MTIARRVLVAFLVAALVSPAVAKPPPPRDWSKSFAVSAAGGFVMGRPKAPVRVIEYASLTCPHCRHVASVAIPPFIRKYVRTGRASYEYRPLILNSTDLAATLVARCGGPARFFPFAETLFVTQPIWAGRTESVTEEDIANLNPSEVSLKMATLSGILPMAAAAGIPEARAKACLQDETAQIRLARIAQMATNAGVQGTPTFFINGRKVMLADWPTLQAAVKKAGG